MIPNLDAMSEDELWAFWRKHDRGQNVRDLFPEAEGASPKVTVNDLAAYACNKATAMRCRRKGSIATAITYESICENIYRALPEYARW